MNKLRAIDPLQYDCHDIDWLKTVDEYAGWQQMCFDYLSGFESSWAGKHVLDIGCGTGWLLERLTPECASVTGMEPSRRLFKWITEHKPCLRVVNTNLISFHPSQRFDLAIAVMSFTHLDNLEAAFQKVALFADELLIVVPAYEYYRQKRFDYRVEVEDIDDESFVATISRSIGVIADIVRKPSAYARAANEWTMTDIIPMTPTQALVDSEPKYAEKKGVVMSQLLRFRRNS